MALQPRCTKHRDQLRADRGLPPAQRPGRTLGTTAAPPQQLSLPPMHVDDPRDGMFGGHGLETCGFGDSIFDHDDLLTNPHNLPSEGADVLTIGCAAGEPGGEGFQSLPSHFQSLGSDMNLSVEIDADTHDASCDFFSEFI